MDVLASLTPAQRTAVLHVDGPLLVLAGPGSGKTRVVTHRVAHLLQQGIPARHILALTFTNKAAEEMRQRLARIAPRESVWMGTFHAFCAKTLRIHAAMAGLTENFSIYDTSDSDKALKQAIADVNVNLTGTSPERIRSIISWAKPRSGNAAGELARRIYPEYQRILVSNNAVDFDDLLMHVAIMLRENPELRGSLDERYRYILVDEYQDTNAAQYAIARALSIDHPNLAATGDPDQSIYGWRGADINNILDFEKDFPHVQVVRLEQNYRSTKNILRVADQLIANNRKRKHKALFTDNPAGEPVRLVAYPSERDEADSIAQQIAAAVRTGKRQARDFAIFYRINALSRQLEQSLRRFNVAYQVVKGVEFYQRKEVKDVLAYLHLLNNPRHDVAFFRIVNTPSRGIGPATLAKVREFALQRGLSMLEASRQIDSLNGRARKALARFLAVYERLSDHLAGSLEELMRKTVWESGYLEYLESSDYEEDVQRVANVQELLTAAGEFDDHHPGDNALERYLENVSLASDTDDFDLESDQVSLMTMHSAKGLEFPVVYVVAAEQGLLPHERSRHDETQLEEERRLMFVALTRAEHELQISYAQKRMFRGEQRHTVPSSFLMELPREEMNVIQPNVGWHEPPWEEKSWDDGDISFDINSFDDDDTPQVKETPATKPAFKLTTAAQMAGGASAVGVSPDQFQTGMLVHHPEYGPGTIASLSGKDKKRTATVQFFSGEEKRFQLSFSPLTPMKAR